jgi:integrase/recombinase XerD
MPMELSAATEVYLRATPQLLELASSRFEQHLRDARTPQ